MLTGTVYDANGAVIPNAKVTLLNRGTRKEQTAVSDDEGVFRVARSEAGEYTLTVESPGFSSFTARAKFKRESVRVNVTLDVAVMGSGHRDA